MEKTRGSKSLLARGPALQWWVVLLLVPLVLVLSGCAGSKKWNYLPATRAEERSIYVIAHGWHAGIALSSEDLGEELGFVREYLRPGRYYEFGWGEAEFYQADKVTAPIFLKAVFWRNPSVMHVFSIPATPAEQFSGSDMVELKLSETGLKHLKDQLRASFKFDPVRHPYPLKGAPHRENRFFEARGYYLITHTCNTWTAKVLASGGVPMDTLFTLRSAGVMRQAKNAKRAYLKLRPSE
ncbi:DUF2459 domain-containing protein [Geomonas subterranea]|uniref:DUF2459 domain-containing protein n=1 Tax=Geomonas subterranea TaxID=2847989 RepID=A0ABX8LBW0_9BACT|nr:DUF2459 domain-containing protein [Geomonas subterranea]QXE89495.1 DUF2459 domain-containing protein [Geomonas subterranea]QXM08390.1 DUF2459 domain-containing protein [Geomonas subterranea]